MSSILTEIHESVPDCASVALLIIDMINDFDFEDGELLYEQSLPVAESIARLKKTAKSLHIPTIYVNDNYGRWQSDFRHLIDHCLQANIKGKPIVELLRPADDDYFVLKPKFSGFYFTPLDLLLQYLRVNTLIICGVAGNMCVQFTANDAYMRDYRLYVPRDCVASNSKTDNDKALQLMEKAAKANTTPSIQLDLRTIITEASQNDHPTL